MSYTLTVLDTGSIQSFIFGSNELRENIGASQLVYWATRDWAFAVLQELVEGRHNVDMDRLDEPGVPYKEAFQIEQQGGEPAAEVIYAGGGNTVILFGGGDPLALAQDFTYRLSRRVLRDSPGLSLYAAHEEYNWGTETSLPETIVNALAKLGRYKATMAGPMPTLGLGVTAACTSTGLPATGTHPDPDKKGTLANRAHTQVRAKWAAARGATDRLRALFPNVTKAGFEWTDDLDRLANLPQRNDSYIAVIHADGNGMGRRIQAFNHEWEQRWQEPRAYIEAMRALSTQIEEAATHALRATIDALVEHLQTPTGRDRLRPPYFPFRPIVFGGDDATWVCAGPWGVSLAQRYLAELERHEVGQDRPPFAAAGIAIVKTHFPFSHAYEISGELAGEAKQRVREVRGRHKDASGLDWHYTTSGISGDLEQIRRREYTTPDGVLYMRPILLNKDTSWRTWDNFSRLIMAFRSGWADRQNKIIALREALRGGRVAVRQFTTLYGESLPSLEPGGAKLEYGWADEDGYQRSTHFDAIELFDMFFDLPTKEEVAR